MKKRDRNTEKLGSGFNNLMNSYILALEENSEDIASMLSVLKSKKLSDEDKKFLKSFKRQIKHIDDSLKELGD